MTPEQATQLAEVHWMLGQVRGTDFPAVLHRTNTIQPSLGNVDWLQYNSVLPQLAHIIERLEKIEDNLGIASVASASFPTDPPADLEG